MPKTKQKSPIQVRPDDELEDYLRQQAALACRSINREVLFRLYQSRLQDQRNAQKGTPP